MIDKLKEQIKKLATKAVKQAEEALGSKNGQEKKQMAINFIISNLPLASIFKPVIATLLSGLIDDAIEFAVYRMNLSNEGT